MKTTITLMLCLLFSAFSHASKPLTKDLVQQYIHSTELVEQMVEADPTLDKQLTDSMMISKAETLSLVKSLNIYPQIKKIIRTAGFADFSEYYDVGYRIMGAMFKKQINNMPAGMSLDNYINQMQEHLTSMKSSGMPKSALKEMEESINEQLKSMTFMKKAAGDASASDTQFITDNFEWMIKTMPMDDDEHPH